MIDLSDKVFLNNSCMIVSHEYIKIGEGTRLGPSVKIYDHDYDFKNNERYIKGEHKTSPIYIGKNCWIGANTIILRGSELGDNCIVGAGCVIKGKYKDNSVIIQKNKKLEKSFDF